MDDLNYLFINNDQPGAIAHERYKQLKKDQPKYSLQYICTRSGIASKGYLSEFMKSKKNLKKEYAKPLGQALGFKGKHQKLFLLMVGLQKTIEPKTRKSLEEKIQILRKSLLVKNTELEEGDYDPFVMSKVFCAFGVLDPPITVESLSLIINSSLIDVSRALTELVKQGIAIKKDREYTLQGEKQFMFNSGGPKQFHRKLVEEAIRYSLDRINSDFNGDESLYESFVVSVKKERYLERIKELRADISALVSDIETEDADELIYLNVQTGLIK